MHLITISKRQPNWVLDAFETYRKRLTPHLKLSLIEVTPFKRPKNSNDQQCLEKESANLLSRVPKMSYVVALDQSGQAWDSSMLAKKIEHWEQSHSTLCLLVGGKQGLSPHLLKQADACWSLSKLIFPHGMVRVILVEQLYRAYCIRHQHPYH